MTSERCECYVYLQLPRSREAVTAARLQVEEVEPSRLVGRFVYGRSYRARTDAVPLDPYRLPISDRVYETGRPDGLFGAVRDALPDFWGRRVAERRLGRLDVSDLDLLLHPSAGRIGALSFGRSAEPEVPEGEAPPLATLADLLEAARRLEEDLAGGPRVPVAMMELLEPGSSLGGARPKALVYDGGESWIAKFPARGDRWSHAPVEAGMLGLARRCGIRVPDFRVVSVGDRQVLLVRRFDREDSPEGTYRHRMVSGLTVLDADESATSRRNWSYPLLADELRRWSHRGEEDRRELFSRMAFNALIGNGDDHPRNHALIAPDRDWELSPAYDLTPSPQVARDVRYLAMDCGMQGREARRRNLLSLAPRFGLTRDNANAVIDRMKRSVAQWPEEIRLAGGTERDCESVAPAFLYEGFEYDE